VPAWLTYSCVGSRAAAVPASPQGRSHSVVPCVCVVWSAVFLLRRNQRPLPRTRLIGADLSQPWRPLLAQSTASNAVEESLCVLRMLEAIADVQAKVQHKACALVTLTTFLIPQRPVTAPHTSRRPPSAALRRPFRVRLVPPPGSPPFHDPRAVHGSRMISMARGCKAALSPWSHRMPKVASSFVRSVRPRQPYPRDR
jgi:hypothetical protein